MANVLAAISSKKAILVPRSEPTLLVLPELPLNLTLAGVCHPPDRFRSCVVGKGLDIVNDF